ncbi:MAG: 4Fe-4S binding protein [Candidatus Cloacimonetes bacterium]|nr:4Fe-4S binding protein [Candidatus Cloacimonadota bacterium]
MKYWERPFGQEKPKVVQGEIFIISDRCKGCSFCVEFCPNGVLVISDEFNSKGFHPPMVTDLNKCTFDGLCESICPDCAIVVVRKEVKIDKK